MLLSIFEVDAFELYIYIKIFQGSDMNADDDDYYDYQDRVTNSLVPGYDDDLLFHMEDMFPSNTSNFRIAGPSYRIGGGMQMRL